MGGKRQKRTKKDTPKKAEPAQQAAEVAAKIEEAKEEQPATIVEVPPKPANFEIPNAPNVEEFEAQLSQEKKQLKQDLRAGKTNAIAPKAAIQHPASPKKFVPAPPKTEETITLVTEPFVIELQASTGTASQSELDTTTEAETVSNAEEAKIQNPSSSEQEATQEIQQTQEQVSTSDEAKDTDTEAQFTPEVAPEKQPVSQEDTPQTSKILPSADEVQLTLTYRTNFGESIVLIGNSDTFGNWDLKNPCTLTWSEGNVWYINLNAKQLDAEFKFVCMSDVNDRWEEGENRKLYIAKGGECIECAWQS